MTYEQLEDRIALAKHICESDEPECSDCPYFSEKDKKLHCMDHLFYDQNFLIDQKKYYKPEQEIVYAQRHLLQQE